MTNEHRTYPDANTLYSLSEPLGSSITLYPRPMVAGDIGLPDQEPPLYRRPHYIVRNAVDLGPHWAPAYGPPFGPPAGMLTHGSHHVWGPTPIKTS